MSLFGKNRDVSLIRRFNRELLKVIISQQCAYYKYDIEKTEVNIYGEAKGGKIIFKEPILLNCLVTREDQEQPVDELGPDFKWDLKFAFLRDDLADINLVPELGDIIMYNGNYNEINKIIQNQYFWGKDPDYPNSDNGNNPLNPELKYFGYNLSIICYTNYITADKIGIEKVRL